MPQVPKTWWKTKTSKDFTRVLAIPTPREFTSSMIQSPG